VVENAKSGGTYVLLLRNSRVKRIRIGKLGVLLFGKGFYAYFGSMFGPGGLKSRIRRHLRKKKVKHWHIDYLLNQMRIEAVYVLPGKNLESQLSRKAVQRYNHVEGFGCSDKRGDKSHLLYLKNKTDVRKFTRFIASAGFRTYPSEDGDIRSW
jgi:Uri superfamily endonuclease